MEKSTIKFSKGLADTIKFDSVPELANYYSTNILTRNWKGNVSNDFMSDHNDRFQGESPKSVLNSLKNGWEGGAERAQKLISLIEGKLDVESNAYKIFPSVVGSTFNVGAYLSGNPMSMRMRKKTMENTNPIHIIIDLTVSADTDHDEIMNRGIAALALARVLVQSRAVQLECICGLRTLGQNLLMSFPVPTAPLDLSTASYLIGRPEVLRRIAFGLVAELGEKKTGRGYDGYIPWLFSDHNWQMEKMLDGYAKMSGYGNDYLAVSGTVHSDKSDGNRNTPEGAAKWVIKNAERLLAAKGE